jgi:hypothetical protein
MRRILVGLLVLLALAGCKADMLEVRVTAGDLADVLAGKSVEVPFEANFRSFGDLDAEQREDLKHLQEIAERYLDIEDFQVNNDGSSTTVEIEGTLPLVGADAAAGYVYALVVDSVDEPTLAAFPYRLRLAAGDRFSAMEDEMQGVNYMSAPDEVNPVQFRLKADGDDALEVLAGGFSMGGENFGVRTVSIPQGEAASLTFKGGAYDDVGGTLLFSKP